MKASLRRIMRTSTRRTRRRRNHREYKHHYHHSVSVSLTDQNDRDASKGVTDKASINKSKDET